MDILRTRADELGFNISDIALNQFDVYLRELLLWNAHTNLTAITKPEEIILKHFVDSLTIIQVIPIGAKTIIDIGSGAGFPGIPVKIIRPDLDITLIEATSKKVKFLSHIITTLKLSGIQALHGRAEDLGHMPEYRERFDVASARAVAKLSSLAEITLPFVQINGIVVAQKNTNTVEVKEAENALQVLGGKITAFVPITIPELTDHQLVVLEKILPTPKKYPRRSGIPSRRPL